MEFSAQHPVIETKRSSEFVLLTTYPSPSSRYTLTKSVKPRAKLRRSSYPYISVCCRIHKRTPIGGEILIRDYRQGHSIIRKLSLWSRQYALSTLDVLFEIPGAHCSS